MKKQKHPSTTAIDARAKRRSDKTDDLLRAILVESRDQKEQIRALSVRVAEMEHEYDRIRQMGVEHAADIADTAKEIIRATNAIWLIDYKAEEAVMRPASVGSPVIYEGRKWWMACPERDNDGKVLITRVEDGLVGEVDSMAAAFIPVDGQAEHRSWRDVFGMKQRRFIAKRVDPKEVRTRLT